MKGRSRGALPPQIATWLLRRLLPAEDAAFVCDDVAERYRSEILPARGAFRSRLWYWGEVMRSVPAALRLRGMRREMEGWRLDARQACRMLVRRPGWTLAVVVVLGLGVGGTTAIFGAVRSLLLRSLPYGGEDRIAAFSRWGDWSGPEFVVTEGWDGPLSAVAAVADVEWTFRAAGGESELIPGLQATAGLFDVLDVRAERGRIFQEGDDAPGAAPVVVLSHGLWQRELGGDPSIVGRTIVLDGMARTVIGVMARDFWFPTPAVRYWAIMPMAPDLWDYGLLGLVGRLEPDVSVEAASGALPALGARLRERFRYSAGWDPTRTLSLTPIHSFLSGDAKRPLGFLMGAVGLLLLIACVNVSTLVLGRQHDRRGEVAVRAALGAGRGRLARQAFTESLVLAVPGGVAGAVVGFLAFGALRGLLPVAPEWREVLHADATLPVAAFAAALFAGTLVGLVGAWGVRRGDLGLSLKAMGRSSPARGAALSGLVLAEVALTVVLVASAGALLRTIANLEGRDAGIDTADLVAVDVAAGDGDFDEAGRHAVFRDLLGAVRGLPGVERAALTQRLPLRDGGWQGPVWAESDGDAGADPPTAFWRHVTPEYFEALGMPVRSGRGLTEQDDARAPAVVLVNRSMADRLWPGRNPIGQRLRTGMTPAGVWPTVVGLVDDVPVTGLRDEIRPVVYIPWGQAGVTTAANSLLVRSRLAPEAVGRAVRDAVRRTDSRLAVARITTMDAVRRQSIAEPRRLMLFLNLFGMLALVLGAVGVYGVLAGFVHTRMFEFGVRLALGSSPGAVVRLVVARAAILIGSGAAAGVALSILASRAYAAFLYGVAANDARTLAGATGVLAVSGALAAWLPCRRAGRADPISVLRAD